MEHESVIQIALADLVRDPILPRRIVDEPRMCALMRSMDVIGLAQPLLVRPPIAGSERPQYRIVLGDRRCIAARRLEWRQIAAVVCSDLSDQEALLLALDSDSTTQSRSYLETAWYYHALTQSGMTQVAIAKHEAVSEATVSPYVRIGRLITQERIDAVGLPLEDVAQLPLNRLKEIADREDDVESRLLDEFNHDNARDDDVPSNFEWRVGRGGVAHARARVCNLEDWSSAERREAIRVLNPLLTEARQLESIADPAVEALRERLADEHQRDVLAIRAQDSARLSRMVDRVADLSLELVRAQEERIRQAEEIQNRSLSSFIRQWGRRIRAAIRRASLSGSIAEPGDSIVEDDAQIPIGFSDRAA